MEKEEIVKKIKDAIDKLTPREKEVIEKRLEESLTLEQIAELFGISQKRVVQIEGKALDKIKTEIKAQLASAKIEQK